MNPRSLDNGKFFDPFSARPFVRMSSSNFDPQDRRRIDNFNSLPRRPFRDDVIPAEDSMSHYPARFGSMERLRSNRGNNRPAAAAGEDSYYNGNQQGQNSRFFNEDPFTKTNTFFDDSMDDFERRFFDKPRMPEWGFAGPAPEQSRRSPFQQGNPSGSGERVIPIRVEGRPKPTPPFKPPDLATKSQQQVPVQRVVPQQQPTPVTQPPPVEQHAVFSKKFEPDLMMQKLSAAPKLSDRFLSGKITSFDEFSDVLSHLPRQPNRPSVDRELDEKLAPILDKYKINEENKAKNSDSASMTSLQQKQNFDDVRTTSDDASAEIPNMVKLFDDAIKSTLDELVAAGQKIGGEVNEITNMAKQALDALRMFLWNASGMKKPDDGAIGGLLKPMSEKIEAIQKFASSKRASPYFNHFSTISEGIPALGWVTVSPTPAPYIKEMIDAAQFYVNRVLKDYKDKDKVHVDWAKSWPKLLTELQMYVKQNHTTGLVWNSSPGAKAQTSAATASKKPTTGPPGPPPPPPPSFMQELNQEGGAKGDAESRAALFADINKGLDITKNLKKVTDDMKTHKNPALKQSAPVPETAGVKSTQPIATKAPAPAPTQQHKAKLALEGGKKWVVEYLKDDKNAVVNVDDMKQVAYIFKCTNSVIQFKGKINSITMDGCTNTSIVFDDVVACVEIINCQRTQIQSMGKLPTLAIQKTDGCQIYLSKESLNAEIVSSKSSEMNLLVPNANGEYDEFALPEQYKTVWNGKKLVTTVVDIA